MFSAAAKNRPFHFGPFPLETLPRDPEIAALEAKRPRTAKGTELSATKRGIGPAVGKYLDLFLAFRTGESAPAKAPLPKYPALRATDIKGCAYFLDAAQVGICALPENAWLAGVEAEPHDRTHDRAVVLLVEPGRLPEKANLAHRWCEPASAAAMVMRAAEISVCVARQIRLMGWRATAHIAGAGTDACDVDLERLAVMAGLAVRRDDTLANPFLEADFAIAAITTDYPLPVDRPLAASALRRKGIGYWLGSTGARPGLERRRRARRPSHASPYPMEQVRRVDRPTTIIFDDEVPRVPKRAAFFERALRGDLGAKSQAERTRFAVKHPVSMAMAGMIRTMVPHQDGPPADADNLAAAGLDDPDANARAIKSLSYFLGADLTGICEIPAYAWFSHKDDGSEIRPYHRYAVVMLIDQGFDTMEGASGDDWISGAQSMRGYMRGAEVAGVMAEHLRALGVPARPQTNADSDVLHIPLILWAGLGELSRIGELVLNPFVGPRFKSVVMTTDLPLTPDRPIDFGLQYFCGNCLKCARECPCDAIPWGDKIIFNGYETWKPDVERCARYRLTNPRGSACGRCMKTCPLNKVVTEEGSLPIRLASWCGVNAPWLKPLLVPMATRLDDLMGNGRRVAAKKWWLDLEIVDGVCVAPRATNMREIDPSRRLDPDRQRMAYYPASMMPPPDAADTPCPVDRKAATAAAEKLESPRQALARRRKGGPAPDHYRPTPLVGKQA